MNKDRLLRCITLFSLVSVIGAITMAADVAAEPPPAYVKFSKDIEARLERVMKELDEAHQSLEDTGYPYTGPDGSTKRLLTPGLRNRFVEAYGDAARAYDIASSDLRRQANQGNRTKCREAAEALQNERPDFEGVIKKLKEAPLGTEKEKLVATMGVLGAGSGIVNSALGRPNSVLLTCTFEQGGRDAKAWSNVPLQEAIQSEEFRQRMRDIGKPPPGSEEEGGP